MLTFRDCPFVLVTCRSYRYCLVCEEPIPPGAKAYRPLREGVRVARYNRLCRPCGEAVGTPFPNKET